YSAVLAIQGLHQVRSSERMRKRDADAGHSDGLDVAVAGVSIDQAQGDSMRVGAGDQQRAMSARLCGAHGDDTSVRADLDGQDDTCVTRQSWRLLGNLAR